MCYIQQRQSFGESQGVEMDKSRRDDLRSLCELASKEHDPQKLLELIRRINRTLEECCQQRQTDKASSKVDTALLLTSRASPFDLDFYCFPGEYRTIVKYHS